jgi:signal peptidase I
MLMPVPPSRDSRAARAPLASAAAAGIDHVCCGDHVSFVVGLGFDGLLQATAGPPRVARLPGVTKPGQKPKTRRRGWIVYWVLTAVVVLVAVAGLVTIHLTGRAFTEPSTSMANTIKPGDLLIAAHTRQVHRGDVIVERQTTPAPGDYLRRVIGLPGDQVACCDASGRITVNGKPLDETYVYPGEAPSKIRFKITVPNGHLWLLGDHRGVAYDSRELGPLAVQVLGRVVLVVRSGHPVLLRTPETFIANGLAPASEGTPPVLVAVAVTLLAWLLFIVLVIIGIVCFVIGRTRRRSRRSVPASPEYRPLTPPPASE